jgi:hypothetical protein
MDLADFVIIGGGWRSGFFLRAARALPDRFRVGGMLVRDPAKGAVIEAEWGVKTFQTLDGLLAGGAPLFAVVALPRAHTPGMLEELTRRGLPVLTETPPAADVQSLERVNRLSKQGGRIQVAEQYIFQPMHAARLAMAHSGLLGNVSQAQVSFMQGYHGISLIRHYLKVGFEPVTITAMKFESPIFKGPDRAGPPTAEQIIPCAQTIAWLDFGNIAGGSRLGIFDFAHDQHRSYVRSDRVLVRGERGEINQNIVRHLADFRTPLQFELLRQDAGIDGNLEGFHHKGITGNGRWWYRNPFDGARLADDEIAVATCLAKMADYARGGVSFYSLAEASHDLHLSLMMEQAAVLGKTIEVAPQAWAV